MILKVTPCSGFDFGSLFLTYIHSETADLDLFPRCFYPVCFPVLWVHYIFSTAGSSGNPTPPNPDYTAHFSLSFSRLSVSLPFFKNLSSCHSQLCWIPTHNFNLVLPSASFTFAIFMASHLMPSSHRDTRPFSLCCLCALIKTMQANFRHVSIYKDINAADCMMSVSVGMTTRKHLSSTPTRPTSSTCGRKRCCRTQRIRGKRRGSRRYNCNGLLHQYCLFWSHFEILLP